MASMPAAAESSRMARMRSEIGVQPGSFVITHSRLASFILAPTLWICVDFAEPSGPSNVMNIDRSLTRSVVHAAETAQPILKPAQVMLAHECLEERRPCEEAEPFAESRAAP